VQRIAGWLYLTDVSANDYTYNWYSRGYEMGRPLECVYGTLATVVALDIDQCKIQTTLDVAKPPRLESEFQRGLCRKDVTAGKEPEQHRLRW
jgi:hypothetical protein